MQTKEQRIKDELDRLSILFDDIDENRRELLEPVLQNAAFMKVTLDELQEEIAKSGAVERYQNGANQYGLKQSAAVQAYNSLIKNYTAVMKVLGDRLPYKTKPRTNVTANVNDEEEEEWKPFNGFDTFDEYLEDYNQRMAEGRLTEEELESIREADERRQKELEAVRKYFGEDSKEYKGMIAHDN